MSTPEALCQAVLSGELEVARAILGDKPKPEIFGKADDGFCAIHRASQGGDYSCLELLLEAGASPDTLDPNGNSALHIVSAAGSAELIRLLCKFGASPAFLDADGRIPYELVPPELQASKDLLAAQGALGWIAWVPRARA